MYLCFCVPIYLSIHPSIYIYIYLCIYMCTHTHVYVCIYSLSILPALLKHEVPFDLETSPFRKPPIVEGSFFRLHVSAPSAGRLIVNSNYEVSPCLAKLELEIQQVEKNRRKKKKEDDNNGNSSSCSSGIAVVLMILLASKKKC